MLLSLPSLNPLETEASRCALREKRHGYLKASPSETNKLGNLTTVLILALSEKCRKLNLAPTSCIEDVEPTSMASRLTQ